ncbi:MAG TPA: hypothetical protein VE621_14865 [Bryobacteraceae bacterium]|nr:hypothetical protein [Bryobacteraceae bacterium]
MDPVHRLLLLFRTVLIIPALSGTGFGIFFLDLPARALSRAEPLELLLSCLPSTFFGLIGIGSFKAAFHQTRHLAMPAKTSVTNAIDISDDISETFETERHVIYTQNPGYAAALLQLNANKIFTRQDSAHARFKRRVLYTVLAIVIGAVVLWQVGQDLYEYFAR